MNLKDALDQLTAERKAKRLRVLWPLIEAKLAEGVSHAAVLDFLNRNGFALSEGVYKTYLYRFRKAKHKSLGVNSAEPKGRSLAQPSSPLPAAADQAKRPATFDYDPKGIPDLLK